MINNAINHRDTEARRKMILNSQGGMALVLTLMALALITAMITEFAYGVYTGTNSLHNWHNSQRLGVMADSAVEMAGKYISDELSRRNYTYPGILAMEFKDLAEGIDAEINIRIEDERSKFNLNSIVEPNGILNEKAFDSLKRLLKNISIDEGIAYYIADWIDPDKEDRIGDSEDGAKNGYLYTVDELLLVKGIDRDSYEKLLPYVTIYGGGINGINTLLININTAQKPVLMALSEDITDELAQRVIDYRNSTPFEHITRLQNVAGFKNAIYNPISAMLTVEGKYFHVRATASAGGIKSIIDAVIGTGNDIKYWRES